ncbi:MAG: small ribosomal subunit biogenesis GTPase RsgA [Cyanobacteriota bacterium]|nr:small ribosomal subunit biogenesis GTPase RsgA [Cyanobacteriota bacterium]
MSYPPPTGSHAVAGKQEWVGIVVAAQANFYQVRLEGSSPREVLCTRRARLKKIGQQVMVGDRVRIEEFDDREERGTIAEVFPRQSELQRPRIANANCILLLFALEEPALDAWQLSRFLVAAETTALTPCLALNKQDLVSRDRASQWQDRLKRWGYAPLFSSVATGCGLAELTEQLAGKITVVAGPSGAGKSSLIDRLIPHLNLRVGEVSGKLQRGRHTTRHVQLFELPGGGLIADSPGFNKPELHCEPTQLADYFPEARARLATQTCQFSDCLHRDEPNCAVRGDWERYEHYLQFLQEAIALQEVRARATDEESALKLKITRSGRQSYEPRLNRKKYRRRSRRTRNQNLQQHYDEEE